MTVIREVKLPAENTPPQGPSGSHPGGDSALQASASTPPVSPKDAQESQLNQALNFYETALKAIQGNLKLLERGFFLGKDAALVGPAIRYSRMVEDQTRNEIKRVAGDLAVLRTVQTETPETDTPEAANEKDA